MEIRIFDVDHGFCAYVLADDGSALLFDCGYNTGNGFRPSHYLRGRGHRSLQAIVISHYDEDHLGDLPALLGSMPVETLYRNKSISASELRHLKLRESSRLGPGITALLGSMGSIAQPVGPYLSGARVSTFHNPYPNFDDTNNLSLVTFLHYRDIRIIFPGDLEKSGWEALLKDRSFREHLSNVNFFVASHHGRENGYLPDVFEYCHPALAIVSDEPIRYETQSTDYSSHASGISCNGGSYRQLLTTRKDGMILIRQNRSDLVPYVETSK